jgi:hypothetical protein
MNPDAYALLRNLPPDVGCPDAVSAAGLFDDCVLAR